MHNLTIVLYKTIMKPTPETYNEWQKAYDLFNNELFAGILPPCLITFQREKNTMGYFSHRRFANKAGDKTDEIALNPAYFACLGLHEALQTLAHEMTHLWQHHYGKPGRGRYHNKEWGDKMECIGLMPSHTGKPGGRRTGDKMSDYIIPGGKFEEIVQKLKDTGFELKWVDRLIALPDRPEEITQIPLATDSTETLVQAAGITPDLAQMIEPDFTRATQNKQGNRSKYTCPGCSVNIWGKPSLFVVCGDCKQPFKENKKSA